MTAIYDKSGIQFPYPDNWRLEEESDPNWPDSVSVQGPDGAFWSLTFHPAQTEQADLCALILNSMREEYDDLEAEPAAETIGGVATKGWDMTFYCLDWIVSARLRTFRFGGRLVALLFQAEQRQFDQLERVFQAMTLGLLNPEMIPGRQ